jgi:hypothetical protein
MDKNLTLMRDGFHKIAIDGGFSSFPDDCGLHFHLRLEDEYTSSFIEVRGLLAGLNIAVEQTLRYRPGLTHVRSTIFDTLKITHFRSNTIARSSYRAYRCSRSFAALAIQYASLVNLDKRAYRHLNWRAEWGQVQEEELDFCRAAGERGRKTAGTWVQGETEAVFSCAIFGAREPRGGRFAAPR